MLGGRTCPHCWSTLQPLLRAGEPFQLHCQLGCLEGLADSLWVLPHRSTAKAHLVLAMMGSVN